MGHNLGMAHDFIAAHKAAGCDGTGIMSYGDPPNQWSTCSVKDMQAHYLTQKNNWCMECKYYCLHTLRKEIYQKIMFFKN